MINFIDRQGSNLNKKILEVEEVERNELGEIIKLYVKEIRNDAPVTVEGTPLNAASLNETIRNIIIKDVNPIVNKLFTDEQKISFDLEALEIPAEVTVDSELFLEKIGTFGSNYSWSVEQGVGITIEQGIITINQTYENTVSILKVIANNGTKQGQKEFSVTVPAKNVQDSASLSVFPDGSSAGMASVSFNIEPNSLVLVENDYTFDVKTNISDDNVLTINVVAGGYPEGGIMEATFKVIVKDATKGYITKDITVTVEFLGSVEVED